MLEGMWIVEGAEDVNAGFADVGLIGDGRVDEIKPVRRLAEGDGARDCELVGWQQGGTMHSQSGLIWTEAPLLTRLATERSVYSKEGTAWTSCKMKKLWHPRVSVSCENKRKLTDACSRDSSAVSGDEDLVGWRGIEEDRGVVVDVLVWRSCVNDGPKVGGDGGWDCGTGT